MTRDMELAMIERFMLVKGAQVCPPAVAWRAWSLQGPLLQDQGRRRPTMAEQEENAMRREQYACRRASAARRRGE